MILISIASIAILVTLSRGSKSNCNHDNAVAFFKRSTYDFSVRFLDEVGQQTGFDFVFSPLSTWLQLISLAEGARGATRNEIEAVTRLHSKKCFTRKFKEILNKMDEELSFMTKRTSIIVIDKLLDVKKSFENAVHKTNTIKIIKINFHDPDQAAAKVNEAIDNYDLNDIESQFDGNDFNLTDLLMSDFAYLQSNWRKPFNPVYTSTETFYSEDKVPVGKVRMMYQEENLNVTEVSFINARVLELPFTALDRISLLVFLPTKGTVFDLFYNLKHIKLSTIFNLFKTEGTKLVKVKLPRFKITSELRNIAELLNDMDVTRMFYPELADFKGISDYPVYVSLMTQAACIEITEGGNKGARKSILSQHLIHKQKNSIPFSADRPFAYLIVDRLTETILFGGIYRNPTIH